MDHIKKDNAILLLHKKVLKRFSMYVSCLEQYSYFPLWSHIEKDIFRPVISWPESAEKSSLDVPDNTIWSARKERRTHSLKEHLFTSYLYNLAHFWNPYMGSKSIRGAQISQETSLMGTERDG